MMAKKTKSWGFWRFFNPLLLYVGFAIALVVLLSLKRRTSYWFENSLISSDDYSSCDISLGKWVFDNLTHPLYSGLRCSYLNDEIACEKFGRSDRRYRSWRWQPDGCNLPRFDAVQLLKRLKGKRMVFVGDSLNRNQWMSMVCLLESSIDTPHKSFKSSGSLMSFKAKGYDATIDFYWSPLLVESNCDDPVNHRLSERIMRADSIEKHARHWTNADIIIFNSYLWWKKPRMKMKVLYGSFDDKDRDYKEVEMIQGFELALKTWSDWLELHVDTLKSQLFFVSLSPTHVWGEDWGMASNQNCYNETEPITKEGYTGKGTDYRMMRIADAAIQRLETKGVVVQMLNITQLSEYRKDGHPSIYRKQWDPLGEDQLANPSSYADCTHWCLPGVPDAWNEILYAYIISK